MTKEAGRRRRAWPLRRFMVADRSMEPGLQHGDGLIAWRSDRPRPGERRVFEHPHRPGFWLVKRVQEVRPGGTDGVPTMTVLSDNAAVTLADSRSFGPVPVSGSYRVLLRIPRRLM